MPTDPRIRDAMAELASTARRPHDVSEILSTIAQGALDSIPAVDCASITVRRPGRSLETVAATSDFGRECDNLQYELREGPCYEALTIATFVISQQVASDPRWPRYGPKVAERGVGAQMAIEMGGTGQWLAGLNLYSKAAHGFDADTFETAETFASHAAVAMGFVRSVKTLRDALDTNRMIGQAAGIVMERYGLDAEQAFLYLVRVSQTSNVKLRTVAQQFVDGVARRQATQP